MASPDAQRVKDALDIAEVVGEYVQLKRAGANQKGLCPFHSEKTPSFNIHPERQIWHCFGCDEGGDVISFVQKVEGLEFPDALRLLAKKAGIVLKPPTPEQQRAQSDRVRFLELVKVAKAFYHKALLESRDGERAREYLKGRDISKDTTETWQLGFAPGQWDALTQFLLKRKVQEKDIVAAGLANKGSRGNLIDTFRNRLLFPLADAHGETLGFTGRVLPGAKDDAPKYVNTRQTLLYDKAHVLFGLHMAKKAIRDAGETVLVEGQTDVISSHQAGIMNVVAASGTALTQQQVKLLSRFAKRVVLAFDVDLAGSEATKRGILLALGAGLDVRVARVPGGKDPDECIRQDPELWKKVIADNQAVMDFVFDLAREGKDVSDVQDKKQIVSEVLDMLSAITDEVEQEHYLQKLAALVRVDESILRGQLQAKKQKQTPSRVVKSSSRETQTSTVESQTAPERDSLTESFLSLVLLEPSLVEQTENYFREEALQDELKPLYIALKSAYHHADGPRGKEIIRQAIQEELPALASRVDALLLLAEEMWGGTEPSASALNEAFVVAQRRLMERFVRDSLKLAQHALVAAERNGDAHRIQLLSEKIQRMIDYLHTISHGSKETEEEKESAGAKEGRGA